MLLNAMKAWHLSQSLCRYSTICHRGGLDTSNSDGSRDGLDWVLVHPTIGLSVCLDGGAIVGDVAWARMAPPPAPADGGVLGACMFCSW